MANQKYTQVTDLLAQGTLVWPSSQIMGILVTGATFDAAHKRVSDLNANVVGLAPVGGRFIAEGGLAMGTPVAFGAVTAGRNYEMALCQDDGIGDALLLALIDTNLDDEPISVTRDGTLIIRPVLVETPPPTESSVSGVWLQL